MNGGAGSSAYVWPMTNEKVRLTIVARLWPAERVSRGCTSEGYSHARGPHDLWQRFSETLSGFHAVMCDFLQHKLLYGRIVAAQRPNSFALMGN